VLALPQILVQAPVLSVLLEEARGEFVVLVDLSSRLASEDACAVSD